MAEGVPHYERMNASELKAALQNGALMKYPALYRDAEKGTRRMIDAVDAFVALYGDKDDLHLYSVPGRTEVSGNHTDHNHGKVLAAAIDRDIIAVAAATDVPEIRVKSEGFPEDVVPLSACDEPGAFPPYSSASLIAGTVGGFLKRGWKVGGFSAYTTTEVLKGSGISSSAAFEVMIGNILNYTYNDSAIPNAEIAKNAQYAENVYFGKPCGLMDQMACAVGGFVAIDFADPASPVIEPISFSLDDAGYALCIVNTGGNHADLHEDYESVPAEMKKVAAYFGKETLRGLTETDIVKNVPALRTYAGDRAILRALHFVRENDRVTRQAEELRRGDVDAFLSDVLASGKSSFEFLQNVYTTKNVEEQGLSLALALTEGLLAGTGSAWRVHGGGFAGTVQVFVKKEYCRDYVAAMDRVFGVGSTMILSVRPLGATRLDV